MVVGGWVFSLKGGVIMYYVVEIFYKDGYRERAIYEIEGASYNVREAMAELKEQLAKSSEVAGYSIQFVE